MAGASARSLETPIGGELEPIPNSRLQQGIGAGFGANGRWQRGYPPSPYTFARQPDWISRLATLIQQRENVICEVGVHDCLNWIRLGVEAVSGVRIDLPAKTARGWLDTFDRCGGNMSDWWSSVLGPPLPAAQARHGDVGLVLIQNYPAGCIVGPNFVIAVGQFGLLVWPRSELKVCWPIG